MSAPLAGKFQDHYELLSVDPRSPTDAIQEAYTKLAAKAKAEGDQERLDSLNLAIEVLIDPLLRREFDKLKGLGDANAKPRFSGEKFFETLGRDIYLRQALLCMLYDQRRKRPFTPSLSVRNIENMVLATSEEIVLALWYLKARNLAANDDKSSVLITVEGIDVLEKNTPDPRRVLPFIKPEFIEGHEDVQPVATVKREMEPEPSAAAEPQPELVGAGKANSLSILRRVLAKP